MAVNLTKNIQLFMYYGRFDAETNVYRWCPTLINANFEIDPNNKQVKEMVEDLRDFTGFDPDSPALASEALERIIPKYFYPNGPFSTSDELIDTILNVVQNETASRILTEHVRSCQNLYKLNPRLMGTAYVEAKDKYTKGDFVGALERYLYGIIHEIPPIGLLYNLTLVTIALSALVKLSDKCTISQSGESNYKLADILSNIMLNTIKKWFISDNDDIFTYYLIQQLRPNEYKKHIQNKQHVDVSIQNKCLFKYLMKHFPLENMAKLKFSSGVRASDESGSSPNLRPDETKDWINMVDKIELLRALISTMTKTPQFQEVIERVGDDATIAEYALLWAYLYRKPRLCRLMAYYGYQISKFGMKTREFSCKVDHKEVQVALKQLFHELLDLLKVVIDEEFITQTSIGLEASIKVLKTLVKVYQVVEMEKISQHLKSDKDLVIKKIQYK